MKKLQIWLGAFLLLSLSMMQYAADYAQRATSQDVEIATLRAENAGLDPYNPEIIHEILEKVVAERDHDAKLRSYFDDDRGYADYQDYRRDSDVVDGSSMQKPNIFSRVREYAGSVVDSLQKYVLQQSQQSSLYDDELHEYLCDRDEAEKLADQDNGREKIISDDNDDSSIERPLNNCSSKKNKVKNRSLQDSLAKLQSKAFLALLLLYSWLQAEETEEQKMEIRKQQIEADLARAREFNELFKDGRDREGEVRKKWGNNRTASIEKYRQ